MRSPSAPVWKPTRLESTGRSSRARALERRCTLQMRRHGPLPVSGGSGRPHCGLYGTDKVAILESPHGPACLHDVPGEFVAHDMRSLDPVLCPLVPHIDMDIGATDRGIVDLDQDLVLCDRGDVHLCQCCPTFWTFLHKR